MPDVFLSYSREDAPVARTYADAMIAAGLDVWWDVSLRSGEAYDEVTEEALRSARAVVVLWSPRSVVSRWVRAEATIAERNKTLIPAMIEPCERPVMFELTQTADLSEWRGEAGDPAWQAFLGDVRRKLGAEGEVPAPAAASAKASSDNGIPFVAVLPMTHRAKDEDLEALAEELTEEITRDLAQYSFFKVIAAARLANWRGKAVDQRALRREFGMRYLVEGKVQRSGAKLRLTFHLIDAESGDIVLSPRFERDAVEVEDSAEELTVAIASQLGEHIIQTELNRAVAKPGKLSGWEHMLRAHAYPTRLGSDNLRAAVEEARKAVAAAPDLGLAHAMLAGLLGVLTTFGLETLDDDLRAEIHSHLRRAMQLDGDNPALLTSTVNAYAVLGDEQAGLRLARRAAELAPHSAQAQFALGRASINLGDTSEAIAAFTQQLRLAPQNYARLVALQGLGLCHCIEGDLDEAEEALHKALSLHPDFGAGIKWLAVVLDRKGRHDAALDLMVRLRHAEPSMSLDQHIRQISVYPLLAQRAEDTVATLRQLWAESERAT